MTVGIALAALLVVTVVAIPLDSPGPLLVLLAAGPLIASTRCGFVVTAIVGLLALALAIALGAAGEPEHLTAALAVGAGGGIAVIAAHLRTTRELKTGRPQPAAALSNGNVDGGATRAQLEAMLRGVADAVTAQAPDGRLIYANEAAVKTLGFESREALQAAPSADVLGRFDIFDEAGRPFPLGPASRRPSASATAATAARSAATSTTYSRPAVAAGPS